MLVLPDGMIPVKLEYIGVHAKEQYVVCEFELSFEFAPVAVFKPYTAVVFIYKHLIHIVAHLMQDLLQQVEHFQCLHEYFVLQLRFNVQTVNDLLPARGNFRIIHCMFY